MALCVYDTVSHWLCSLHCCSSCYLFCFYRIPTVLWISQFIDLRLKGDIALDEAYQLIDSLLNTDGALLYYQVWYLLASQLLTRLQHTVVEVIHWPVCLVTTFQVSLSLWMYTLFKQVRMYYRSGTYGCCCISMWQMLFSLTRWQHTTFLRGMMS